MESKIARQDLFGLIAVLFFLFCFALVTYQNTVRHVDQNENVYVFFGLVECRIRNHPIGPALADSMPVPLCGLAGSVPSIWNRK